MLNAELLSWQLEDKDSLSDNGSWLKPTEVKCRRLKAADKFQVNHY